jgi:hypothetical protein
MNQSYRKGIASHPDPESCVGRCKREGEALTGAQAGRALSCEINLVRVPMSFSEAEGNIQGGKKREPSANPAQSETPRQNIPQRIAPYS